MIKQVAVARAYVGVAQLLVYFQRAGCHPFAVEPVAPVLGDFADVYLRVEVCCEGFSVVAGVAVNYVEGLHGREVVLGGIGGEHARYPRVESASEDSCQPGFLEALAVGPLP